MNLLPNCIIAACCSLFSLGVVAGANGQEGGPDGELHTTQVPASRDPLVAECGYQLWIPKGTPSVRCVFAINKRAAGKHLFQQDMEWRAMAARNHAAMMYCKFQATGVRDNGYGASMLCALDQFAAQLGRPELKHAPLVLWGHSMGGRVVQDFVRFQPQRVLAFHIALRLQESPPEFMQEADEDMRVPGLYLMGENDKKPKDIREHFERARAHQSPRAWVWLPGQAHWPKGMGSGPDETTLADWRAWSASDVVIPWTEAMIRLRLPDDADPSKGPVQLRKVRLDSGWLADIESGRIAPYGDFPGDASRASWFPNEAVAKAWAKFAFPQPPQNATKK